MKRITIEEMKLKNFKGIRDLHLKDLQKETFILGANRAGKTSVMDAFTWLLFGKDSTDRTNFGIKTYDSENNTIPKLEHSVFAIINVDGEKIRLQRTLREKWVKKRGEMETTFEGNETLYEWNDVPMTMRDYNEKINDLVDETIFKLITSPTAFTSLPWQAQREILVEMEGDITEEDVARENPKFFPLLELLREREIDELEKMYKATIRKSKTELKTIPTRIDELIRNTPEAQNWEEIERDLKLANNKLQKIDDQITDRSKAQEEKNKKYSEKQDQIFALKRKNTEIEFFLRQEAEKQVRESGSAKQQLDGKLRDAEILFNQTQNQIKDFDSQEHSKRISIADYEKRILELRKSWEEVNKQEFKMNEEDTACPACQREFDPEKIEELKEAAKTNFDKNKESKLHTISEQGKTLAARKKDLEEELKTLAERKEKSNEQLKVLTTQKKFLQQEIEKEIENNKEQKTVEQILSQFLEQSTEIKINNAEIEKLQTQVDKPEPVNYDDLQKEKQEINALISELQEKLSAKKQIQLAELRKEELIDQENELANEVAEMEKIFFLIEELTKEKMTRLEGKINARFNFVKFKLFRTLVNGSEEPTCEALINGVPFSDANTESRVNAGLDIINTLSKKYEVSAPIFIDNRESVTELIETDSQIINLVVSPEDKKLKITAKTQAVA